MHELAITESILKIAISEGEKHGASKVLEIRLKIGAFSGVVPQYIQEYFALVSRDTIASNAVLKIEQIDPRILCLDCNAESDIDRWHVRCPVCGSQHIQLLRGQEYYVDSLEVE